MTDSLRDRIAWLLWCANEGYLTDDDRAGVSNIFTADPSALHPDDAFSLPHWRGMADAVILELEAVPQRIMLSHASQAAESNRLDAADWLERELASVGLECGAGWVLYHLVDGVVARLNGAVDE